MGGGCAFGGRGLLFSRKEVVVDDLKPSVHSMGCGCVGFGGLFDIGGVGDG